MQDFRQADANAADHDPFTAQSIQSLDEALEQIDRILHQMLLLANLSASSDVNVERENLQKVLDRLKEKINRIVDTI